MSLQTHIVTLIAPPDKLSGAEITFVTSLLTDRGLAVEDPVCLEGGRAADVRFSLDQDQSHALEEDLRQALASVPVDFALQALLPDQPRKRQLLLADMDSTIVTGETLDEMSDHLGLKDKIAAITAKAMNGEIDFQDALRERVAMLKGLKETAVLETLKQIGYTSGAADLVRTMRLHGARCVLVSGGFEHFTSKVREEIGFHADFANRLEVEESMLTGRVLEPILDKSAKLERLTAECEALGVSPAAAVTVGDGANDLMMIEAATDAGGLGVAFHAKPTVAARARFRIQHTDLRSLLYIQGYHCDSIED